MPSKMDATHPHPLNMKLTNKQRSVIDNINCWYVKQFIKMSLIENRLAGKKMRNHNR